MPPSAAQLPVMHSTATLRTIMLCLVLLLAGCSQSRAIQPDQAEVVVDESNNLHLSPPAGGDVFVSGASISALKQTITAQLSTIAALTGAVESMQEMQAEASTVVATQAALIASQASTLASQSSTINELTTMASDLLGPAYLCVAEPEPIPIPTFAASAMDYALVDGMHLLAIAEHYKPPNVHALNSTIYRWNPVSRQFVHFQSIPTVGARFVRFFEIASASYVIFVNYFDGSSYNVDSHILVYNSTSTSFVSFQLIPTHGGATASVASVAGATYLAIANHYANAVKPDSRSMSEVFVFNSSRNAFVSVQNISTYNTDVIEISTLLGYPALFIANQNTNSNNNALPSYIMSLNAVTKQFTHKHNFTTQGCVQLKPFTIGSVQYLAVVNFLYQNNYHLNLTVHSFDGSGFDVVQTIPTVGAVHAEIFVVHGRTYMFVSQLSDFTNYMLDSPLYQWIDGQQFVLAQTIPTRGAFFSRFFVIDNNGFLGVPMSANSTAMLPQDSLVFKWCGSRLL
jgi:hypothetical protein